MALPALQSFNTFIQIQNLKVRGLRLSSPHLMRAEWASWMARCWLGAMLLHQSTSLHTETLELSLNEEPPNLDVELQIDESGKEK
jgi:hypothetical protein